MDSWVEGHFFAHCLADFTVADAHVTGRAFKRNTCDKPGALNCSAGNTTRRAVIELVGIVYGDGHAIGVVFDSDLELGHLKNSRGWYVLAGDDRGVTSDQCKVDGVVSDTKMLAISRGMGRY